MSSNKFLKTAIVYIAVVRPDITAKNIADALPETFRAKKGFPKPTVIDDWIQHGYEKGMMEGKQGTSAEVLWQIDDTAKEEETAREFYQWLGYTFGFETGLRESLAQVALKQLNERWGGLLDIATVKRIEDLSSCELDALGRHLQEFQTLADLNTWLPCHSWDQNEKSDEPES